MRSSLLAAAAAAAIVAAAAGQERRPAVAVSRLAIVRAEDARAATPAQLELLTSTAADGASPFQALAVRALGRLERPELVAALRPLLDAPAPAVRAEAASAMAQAAGGNAATVLAVRERLLERLVGERDADVTGAIAEALGRLPIDSPAIATATESALVGVASRFVVTRRIEKSAAGGRIVGLTLTPTTEVSVPLPALLGALRGLESFARGRAKAGKALASSTVDRLQTLALARPPDSPSGARAARERAAAARVRRLALLCLLPVNAVDANLASRAQRDPDAQVRRLAMMSASASRATIDLGLADSDWLVRYEALARYGRRFQAAEGCEPIARAIGASADHVSLLAIDLLAGPCRPQDGAVETLIDLAAGIGQAAWHRPAHAMVALAKASPGRAKPMLPRFLSAADWQARMYAARAAADLGDAGALRALAEDANDNVREAAVAGLSRTAKHDADAVFVKALQASDFQLVMTAARALEGSPDRAAAVPALVSSLARLTSLDSDTSRDPRLALIERLAELGSPETAAALKPYFADADPRVAAAAAKAYSAWTGNHVSPAPRARPDEAGDFTEADIDGLSSATVRVTMSSGGEFEVKLTTDLAPVSCLRFASLAAKGYYDGLTFHRVIPNFLIQGGSPGANEYSGYTRYTRDELGRASNERGTVGVSTRGRDTGDAQFYVNLVDSPRLDHDYTIFGVVTRGMDVVDGILEGDVMRKVEVVRRPSLPAPHDPGR